MSREPRVSFESSITNTGNDSLIIEYRKSRSSQWEQYLGKQMEEYMKKRKSSVSTPRKKYSRKEFPTGSQYEGEWDDLGMNGQGRYTFPHGVIYEGEFFDGHFHGSGNLLYPNGMCVKGTWNKGVLVTKTIVFPDGLQYADKDWEYCAFPDRRFCKEVTYGLQPAGESFLTNNQPTRNIPQGCFDSGDGFYDPERKVVFDYEDFDNVFRAPMEEECLWIERNCRKSTDEPSGVQPDLYEVWLEPKISDFENMEDKTSTSNESVSEQKDDDDYGDSVYSIYRDLTSSLDNLQLGHWPNRYSRSDFEKVFNNPLDVFY